MGVEYVHYLVPEDNTYRPGPEELSRLVRALLEGSFVAEAGSNVLRKMTFHYDEQASKTGCYARLAGGRDAPFPCPCSPEDVVSLEEQDFRLVWPVESSNESGLKDPLAPFPEWGDAYYNLELQLAKEFVYHLSEIIDPFDSVACVCGQPLEFYDQSEALDDRPVFSDGRIFRTCPSCGTPFRPQERVAQIRDGYTGEARDRAGGVTYLFAVVVDCGKSFAREGWPMRATDEFMSILTRVLGQRFYEVGDIH